MSNKDLAKQTQSILKELGHDVSLGHAYELLAKLTGAKSWNVAKAMNIAFVDRVPFRAREINAEGRTALPSFTVKIYSGDEMDVQLCKYYVVTAKSRDEAKAILKEYLHVREDMLDEEAEKYKCKFKETELLLKAEDHNDFTYNNWEVASNSYSKNLGEAYERAVQE